MTVKRRAGGQWRDRALDALHEYCQQARAAGTTYVPVWEARAAVCWKLRIVDDEFDRAVTDMIAGRRGDAPPMASPPRPGLRRLSPVVRVAVRPHHSRCRNTHLQRHDRRPQAH